jgi:hypothetical protein
MEKKKEKNLSIYIHYGYLLLDEFVVVVAIVVVFLLKILLKKIYTRC